MLVELRKSFTNYGLNKRRSCNWVVSHLRITEFYAKQTAPVHAHKIETLEQASQLAQDIDISLRFSSERRVIPKARKQPSPNINATRDSKGKSVIGESSKNAKGSQCFKYQYYGHVAA